MEFLLFEIVIFWHYVSLDIGRISIGGSDWSGSLLFLEWDQVELMCDFLYLNSGRLDAVG